MGVGTTVKMEVEEASIELVNDFYRSEYFAHTSICNCHGDVNYWLGLAALGGAKGLLEGVCEGGGTSCAVLSFKSRPYVGCSYVPEIRTGTTSPLCLFLKNGSITFSNNAFAPLVVFEIFESTCSCPRKSILWLIRL